MGVCSWDWGALGSILGAIATFTGAGVALYISKSWRDQKGSDVLSEISKETYKQILAHRGIQDYIDIEIINKLNKKSEINIDKFNTYLKESRVTNKKIRKNLAMINQYKKLNYLESSIRFLEEYEIEINDVRINILKNEISIKEYEYYKLINDLRIRFDETIDKIKTDLIKYIFHKK